MKVAQYISQFLVEHGVSHNFTVTGGGAMHLNDALGHQEGLKCIYNHNEQGSAIAAESYARLTGKIAALCVTSGPGGTNAITGVMGGWLDSIPMFVLSGQVKRETTLFSVPELQLRQLGDQEFDIIGSVSNMTKYAVMITDVNDVAYHMEKAWYLANHGRKGPVWLDIPLDVQGAPVDLDAMRHFDPQQEYDTETIAPSKDDVHKLIDMIREANAPLIFAGSGVRLSDSVDLLLEVVKKYRIPVAVAWNSGDIVAYDNEFYAGSPSREGTRGSSFIVQNCDLVIVLGSRMSIRTITYNKHDFAKNAKKIMVDIDPEELKKPTFIPDWPICCDVHLLLEELLKCEYEAPQKHEKWKNWCREMVEKYPAVLPEYHHLSKEETLNPYVFVDRLFYAMNDKDVLTLGNGSACVMTFQGAKIKQGQRMYTNAGCAAMGYGLPAALGAAIARAEDEYSKVICIDGDGSVMMNIQELATIAYHHLNIKLFILNNNGYHSIRQTQRNLMQPPYIGIDEETGVGFPNWKKLADAFGFQYEEIDNEPDLDKVIGNVLESTGPILCNVVVDPEQNFVPKLSSKVLPDGRIVSPSMDDMFPFLPRDEYEGNKYIL